MFNAPLEIGTIKPLAYKLKPEALTPSKTEGKERGID